ncbi:hypothetical protein L3Y34_016003 [Caenorhabditis briggsae]|uniref:Uncharacterized protein n=1 Tax=Caenorhabditis briggsae TaxID=6238 RepID=A0AAE9DW01_CAEBR|nr:hypothetical protein L3Y34_016003 [Caenorhabditis briggsae]
MYSVVFVTENIFRWGPWLFVGGAVTVFVGYLTVQLQNLKKIASQNQEILKMLTKDQNSEHEQSTMIQTANQGFVEDEYSEQSSEYQIPEFIDSDLESECDSLRTGSSGYNTDPEIDYDWEYFKIMNAPTGPVPSDQVILCFTCKISGCYLKAIVDEDHTVVHMMTYENTLDNKWEWKDTTCITCIQKVREILADGGCPIPFAIDLMNETMDYAFWGAVKEESEEEANEEEVIKKPIQPLSDFEGFLFSEPEYDRVKSFCGHLSCLLIEAIDEKQAVERFDLIVFADGQSDETIVQAARRAYVHLTELQECMNNGLIIEISGGRVRALTPFSAQIVFPKTANFPHFQLRTH